MNKKLIKIARIGFVAKGMVFAIIGCLVLLAAVNIGNDKPGLVEVMEFLDEQPFGKILLLAMSAGLTCYAIWKFIEAIKDPENNGNSWKMLFQRFSFFMMGLTFLGLAILGVLLFIGSDLFSSGSSGTDEARQIPFLVTNTGLALLGIAGIVTAIIGIGMFVKAYKADFAESSDLESMHDKKRLQGIKTTAKVGMTARAFIFLIIAYSLMQAAFTSNPDEIKTADEVFSFIQDSPFGAWLLALMGLGIMAFASYMFLLAKYRKFGDDGKKG